MSEKQDRINDVLAQRITQLEGELRTAQRDLSSAQAEKEHAEQEKKLLKDEAFEVVEQWSAENTELRRKLTVIEKESAADKVTLRNRDDMVACLKEELDVAQRLTAQYSTEIDDQQQKNRNLEQQNAQLIESLASARSDLASSAQRVVDYERLVAKFQVELKAALASQKKDTEVLDHLRSSLAQATAENQALRDAGESVSSSMERLLEHVARLKEENESLRKNCDQLLSAKDELARQLHRDHEERRQLSEELGSLSARVAVSENEAQQLREKCERTEKQFAASDSALRESQTAAEQQLQVIQTLESDVTELKDREITMGKVLCDLQAELLRLNQQLGETSQQKEDLQTEFAAVKESYATALMELDNLKQTSSNALAAMQAEFTAFKRDSTERCMLAEQNCSSAWLSVQELTDALRAQQLSELAQREKISRSSILLYQQASIGDVFEQRFHAVLIQLSDCFRAREQAEERIRQNEFSAAKTAEQISALSNRCRTSEQTVSEQRKALSMLESQLSQGAAHLKEVVLERDTFAKDNAWLRDQVESMRQELGELDELLNSNLNEMREENERLQLENDSMQRDIAAANHKEQEAAVRITALQVSARDLENELRAQTKTLEITEAELQALKAQVENLSTSLDFSKRRCEELEVVNTEADKSISALMLQAAQLQERLGSQESKFSLILSEKRKESESLKGKLNAYVEKCEQCEQLLHVEIKARKEVESASAATKEHNGKLRSALDELKIRCASDASNLKELLVERDNLIRDRDIIVEKYNKLHDAFRNVRREAHSKVADELKRVMELAMSQEMELQTLRKQNSTLKKSISMFVESAQPKAEAVFMERLNLTEGPLRHPKKRSVASTAEQQ
ncbi:conserved hypothetical protein [Leishmania mexicana MHOM/GT/2001/U1103]|uniref:Uncharacterized protein n=1 Tax=Leishmania mexicana (strain MHOM/GT/2001/U1103) TaxID=929439 RepID=E9B5Q6_LEIMU|nr:conserved hypothetical protein [Leishmania mexicana MHOM/GT/2001/U1103]CBZ30576.1 conserved hypothetical protein [Leishmania mexicana MHOM/GT/2001/U1103]